MGKKQGGRGRFSARRKKEGVLRLLRGEDLDTVSRDLGVTAARLSGWRDEFIAAGTASLKSRQPDSRDEELMRHKAMIGELTMRNEVLREGLRRLQQGDPLGSGRSKR